MTSVYGGQYAVTPLTAGKRHRVRPVNTAVNNHFVVSLDGHSMQIIASDFVPTEPTTVETLLVGIGERYDIIIDANQAPGAYWFRVDLQDTAGCGSNFNNGNIRAIFAYTGHETETPISSAYTYTQTCNNQTGLVPYWNSYVPQGRRGWYVHRARHIAAAAAGKRWFHHHLLAGQRLGARRDWEKPTFEYVRSGDTSYPNLGNIIQLPNEGVWTYWVIQEVLRARLRIRYLDRCACQLTELPEPDTKGRCYAADKWMAGAYFRDGQPGSLDHVSC